MDANQTKGLGKLVLAVAFDIRGISTLLVLVCFEEAESIAVLFKEQASAATILV